MKCERCGALGQLMQEIEWQGRHAWLCSLCFHEVRQENILVNTNPIYYSYDTSSWTFKGLGDDKS